MVKRIAHLSRIALPDNELPQMVSQLERIFSLVAEMQAVPTQGVEPMAHPLDLRQPLRSDALRQECLSREELMASAPRAQDGLFLVPKVIE
ncbi:Asp-tRNA(Asn)/Glu-tRNA(Gln) amidotransferase subunit GatC [Acidithiobacillus sp. CV18-2]|uniref:Aspartyl/glutamyl-tRNA(Asn/Gln) amidotransferase subunit C n=2 Tax=Igneacidithiobacillus copahuensis TaxID=2724909 RepID=A0AAE2YRZ1_9PROT|nr:Asp-tRNA(Asn)/Glu-tRNA(Gln) amidotransferase subunit GatC [Acidithiobacillus sp. CV18-3]MBU2756746.1 Asp-tRNA(Asn)/Glu-tRNA(Gln) amidotransferase subunit GatC [Acidithiobacillus sp. BN09-2]MBU2777149.1 Asp-tRNA(Asn)/Glu-tRNA(Gln) amidotransferase subunit GatC [Acidithiobacillus sp. CV18-2]MBU2788996.1 Asp-tRNA(Asn)/Glu-tRNA(Gln) amidotransferase subunit GatC [Igneacidithiobacillus copahuensis]MBU2795617.1 Asp-tRNA(Asn)/Glu-tRNA(Gln) amidotransferase subunit GatC [Acidithiobacillus sp. VAN18-